MDLEEVLRGELGGLEGGVVSVASRSESSIRCMTKSDNNGQMSG